MFTSKGNIGNALILIEIKNLKLKLKATFMVCLKITTNKCNLAPDGINYFDAILLQTQRERNKTL